jgi:alpha-glucosidase (family GH31 glycosyl hydrolase)
LKAAQTNLKLRYSLLKHYYSLFIGRRGVGTIFNPLFFVFPLDNNNFVDEIAETQFLIGNSLMAAPILQQGVTSRNVYFTSAIWFDFYTGK